MSPDFISPQLRRQQAAERKGKRKANARFIRATNPAAKPPSVPKKIEKAAWDACSKAFRQWWVAEFGPSCFYCGVNQVQDACHVISRRKRSIKFNWHNLTGGCKPCNWRDANESGYHDFCVSRFIQRFGANVYQRLVELSRQTCTLTRMDIQEMREIFNRMGGVNV